jgi:nitrite reductase (NAD(P)H)
LSIPYDVCVLATGSSAALPPYISKEKAPLINGVFVYRTIGDLDKMIAFTRDNNVDRVTVVGGGLLGLEAAKALLDLGTERKITIIERNEWVIMTWPRLYGN